VLPSWGGPEIENPKRGGAWGHYETARCCRGMRHCLARYETHALERFHPPAAEPTRPSYAVALANSTIAKSAALTLTFTFYG